jgi:hypothetical protein
MSAVFVIIASLFLVVLAFALSRRKPEKLSHSHSSVHPLPYQGLFAASDAAEAHVQAEEAEPRIAEEWRVALRARAGEGDFAVLVEAHADAALYHEALDALVAFAVGAGRLDELTACIAQDERLRVNARLARLVLEQWLAAPQPNATAATLHMLARADDAAMYQAGVKAVLREWRAGRLAPLSAAELRALIESQYWLLSAETRGSGGGFVLKEFLAAVRRELLAARSASA